MKPLEGRRILVTRRRAQAGALADGLAALGATVIEVPLIAQEPPDDAAPFDAALGRLDRCDWIAFTSANAVGAVAERLAHLALALPPGVKLASVGPSTSAEIAERFPGRRADLEPASEYRADGLAEAFRAHVLTGRRVLLPVSDRARDTLARGLRERGAEVEAVVAYRTVTPAGTGDLLERARAGGLDLVTLASPSAVEGLVAALGGRARGLAVAAIGPVTEEAARAAGLDVRVVAAPATAEGLVAAVARHFQGGS
jgi:uroporphyrinogen III methyltransferase / synthase